MRDDRDDRRDPSDRRGDPIDRRENSTDPEDLDERVAELEERVRELRDELGRPPEGPMGLPRPPTPREVLSFTGEYAIPTAIAVLEANVRALKALQQVVRVLDPDRSVVDEERDRLESRAADASRATLDRLESALADVETTIRENDVPRDDAARDILDDARRINREIRDRVGRERTAADEARERAREADRQGEVDRERDSDSEHGRGRATGDDGERPREDSDDELQGGTTIELTDEGDGEDGDESDAGGAGTDDRVEVDVEAELRSIKDEMERRQRGSDADPATDGVEEDPEGAEENSAGPEGDAEGRDGSTKTDDAEGTADDAESSDRAGSETGDSDEAESDGSRSDDRDDGS